MTMPQLPDLSAYADATDRTAIYPGAGTGSVTALTYVALGLAGEATEVGEKAATGDAGTGLSAELGDVAWYLGRFHRELGVDANVSVRYAFARAPACNDPVWALTIEAGRTAETMKKALRDDAGQLSAARCTTLVTALARVTGAWLTVHQEYQLDPAVTLDANLAKLADRADRGVLTGSGDSR